MEWPSYTRIVNWEIWMQNKYKMRAICGQQQDVTLERKGLNRVLCYARVLSDSLESLVFVRRRF